MAMKPEDIIAQINRENEFLKGQLVGLQGELNATRREKDALQQCFDQSQRAVADADWRDEMRKQEVTDARWTIEAVQRDNNRLRAELDVLQSQLTNLQSHCHDAILQAEHAWGLLGDRNRYIDGLRGHIAFIENHSTEGMAASHAAFKNMEAYFQNQLHSVGAESQQLQDNLDNLQRFIYEKTNKDRVQQQEMMEQLVTARAKVRVAEQIQSNLERKLNESEQELKALKTNSAELISARDSLNQMLLKDLEKKSANDKKTREKAKETAQAKATTEKLKRKIKLLEEKIKEKKEEVQTKQKVQNNIQNDISAEKKRKVAAEREVAKHKQLAERLQNRIKSLETNGSDLSRAIRDKEITIKQLGARVRELVAEVARERRIAGQWQKLLWKQVDINDELANENARLVAHSLYNKFFTLQQLGRNRYFLFVGLLENVLAPLQNLKSAPAANRAANRIRTFLLAAQECLNKYQREVISDMAAINKLVIDLQKITPVSADKDNFREVKRLFGEVMTLQLEAEALLVQSKEGMTGMVLEGGPLLLNLPLPAVDITELD